MGRLGRLGRLKRKIKKLRHFYKSLNIYETFLEPPPPHLPIPIPSPILTLERD